MGEEKTVEERCIAIVNAIPRGADEMTEAVICMREFSKRRFRMGMKIDDDYLLWLFMQLIKMKLEEGTYGRSET